MGVSIGKKELPHCFFTGRHPRQLYPPADTDLRNGTALPGRYQLAEVRENCIVNITALAGKSSGDDGLVPSNAVVGGFAADGSMLGLCVTPPIGSPEGPQIPGQLFLSGYRKGECCYNSGYLEHCITPGQPYSVATFHPRPAGTAAVTLVQPSNQQPLNPQLPPLNGKSSAAVKNGSATECLLWSATDTVLTPYSWKPGGMGVCRAIVLDNIPPSVSIGKLEGVEAYNSLSCYFPEQSYTRPPATKAPHNGSPNSTCQHGCSLRAGVLI